MTVSETSRDGAGMLTGGRVRVDQEGGVAGEAGNQRQCASIRAEAKLPGVEESRAASTIHVAI